MKVAFLMPWFRGDWSRVSIGRYALGIRHALEPDTSFSEILGTHYNLPTAFRRRIPGEAEYRALPRSWQGQADVIHSIDTWQTIHRPRFAGYPFVATIHDAIPRLTIKRRGLRSAGQLHTFWRGYRSAEKATKVITPSEATRSELLGLLSIDPARVTAIPVIVPNHFRPPSAGELQSTVDLPPRPVILSVGTAETYKNLPLLIQALAEPALSGVSVVRVGPRLKPKQAELAERLEVAQRIVELGSVSEEALLELMWRATVLAQPSITEGFGMPVAEAMACGLPVVVSNGGALPEVVGDAGKVVPLSSFEPNVVVPEDARAFARALAEVIEDGEQREAMAQRGVLRVREFRADVVGPRVLAVYRDAVSRAGS